MYFISVCTFSDMMVIPHHIESTTDYRSSIYLVTCHVLLYITCICVYVYVCMYLCPDECCIYLHTCRCLNTCVFVNIFVYVPGCVCMNYVFTHKSFTLLACMSVRRLSMLYTQNFVLRYSRNIIEIIRYVSIATAN